MVVSQSPSADEVRTARVCRARGPVPLFWWLVSLASGVGFAAFVRITLYGTAGPSEVGSKGLVVPAAVSVALLLWFALALRLLRVSRVALVAASFSPMLGTLPITFGVLTSEAFAREYWIDRSLKIELLLGIPVLVLLLQAGIWLWLRHGLTWRRALPMLAVLGLALGLRWAGMGWGLPFAFQPEESSIYVRWAMELALHDQWNPHYFQNPSLLIYLFGLQFIGLFSIARLMQMGQDAGDLYMVFRGEQDLFYGLARLDSVLFGTATVFVTYLIARRLWNERAGIAAAATLAANFLHVRNSQYAVNDVPSTFFLVLSFYYALRVSEKGGLRDYLLAGLMAGLAASTKYNAGMVVVSVAAAHWIQNGGLVGSLRPRPLAGLSLAATAALVGFVIGTPYSVLDFAAFRGGFLSQLDLGGSAWSGQSAEATAWQFLAGAVHGGGAVVALLALVGVIGILVGSRAQAALLLSFPLCYFGFMSAMDLFFVRWVVPVIPFVALWVARGVETVLPWVPGRKQSLVAASLLVLALLQPTLYSLRLDWLAHQKDTRQIANEWAERNLLRGSKIAVEAFSLLDQESLAFRATLHERDIELVWRATMHDLEYYQGKGFDYIAVSSFMYDRAFAHPDKYADRIEFYQRLDRELKLLAVFTPRIDGKTPPFALDDLDTPFWHLFEYDRPGPTVKVYRLGG